MTTRVPRTRLDARKVPTQARSRDTVDVILEGAAQVFERNGYAAATTNRIAERAGVSVGSVYQYFPNKDALLVALARRHLTECVAEFSDPIRLLRARPPRPAPEVIERFVGAMVALHAVRPGLHRVLFERTPLPEELWEAVDELERAAAQEVAAWLRASPAVTVADPDLAAELVVQTVEALTHRLVISPPDGVDAHRVGAEIVALVLAYLT